jgi:hypothetical protein
MRTLHIEWKHLDLDKGTCLRCSKTGKTLQQVISELKKELKEKNIQITFIETKLSEKKIQQSNMILIDGKPIESILSGAEIGENYCTSCSCLTGHETYCRTVSYKGETFEEIPEKLVRLAVFKTLQIDDDKTGMKDKNNIKKGKGFINEK